MLVELDAQRRKAAQRVAPNGGVVLADASGEGDDVGTAQQRKVGPDVLAQPVHVDVVRQLRCFVA